MGRMQCDCRGRDQNDIVTILGMPKTDELGKVKRGLVSGSKVLLTPLFHTLASRTVRE